MSKIESGISPDTYRPGVHTNNFLVEDLKKTDIQTTNFDEIQDFLLRKLKVIIPDPLTYPCSLKQPNWVCFQDSNALNTVILGGDKLLSQDPISNSQAIIIYRQAISEIATSKKNDEREFSLVAPRVVPRGLSISGINPDLQRILSVEYNLLNPKKELRAEQISISLKPEEVEAVKNPTNGYSPLLTVVPIPKITNSSCFGCLVSPKMTDIARHDHLLKIVRQCDETYGFVHSTPELKANFTIALSENNLELSFNPKNQLKSWEILILKKNLVIPHSPLLITSVI